MIAPGLPRLNCFKTRRIDALEACGNTYRLPKLIVYCLMQTVNNKLFNASHSLNSLHLVIYNLHIAIIIWIFKFEEVRLQLNLQFAGCSLYPDVRDFCTVQPHMIV